YCRRRRRFYRLLARQVRLQHVPLSPIHTRAWCILNTVRTTPAPATAAPHCPRRGYHLPARRYRVQCLTTFRSKPAPVRDREYDAQPRLPARCTCRLHRAPLSLPLRDAAHLLAYLALSVEAFCSPLVGAMTSISASTVVFYSASSHPVSFRAPRSALRVA
ncbi:hypothetical protein B0H13DRAFT_2061213, partial [Mycena leptocephala]